MHACDGLQKNVWRECASVCVDMPSREAVSYYPTPLICNIPLDSELNMPSFTCQQQTELPSKWFFQIKMHVFDTPVQSQTTAIKSKLKKTAVFMLLEKHNCSAKELSHFLLNDHHKTCDDYLIHLIKKSWQAHGELHNSADGDSG